MYCISHCDGETDLALKSPACPVKIELFQESLVHCSCIVLWIYVELLQESLICCISTANSVIVITRFYFSVEAQCRLNSSRNVLCTALAQWWLDWTLSGRSCVLLFFNDGWIELFQEGPMYCSCAAMASWTLSGRSCVLLLLSDGKLNSSRKVLCTALAQRWQVELFQECLVYCSCTVMARLNSFRKVLCTALAQRWQVELFQEGLVYCSCRVMARLNSFKEGLVHCCQSQLVARLNSCRKSGLLLSYNSLLLWWLDWTLL